MQLIAAVRLCLPELAVQSVGIVGSRGQQRLEAACRTACALHANDKPMSSLDDHAMANVDQILELDRQRVS